MFKYSSNVTGTVLFYDSIFIIIFYDIFLVSPEERTYTSEQSSTSNQYTLNPEILVIIDYDLYSQLNGNWESIISYVVTFWNAVDLKFRSVETLTYRLNIAGIIIAVVIFFNKSVLLLCLRDYIRPAAVKINFK